MNDEAEVNLEDAFKDETPEDKAERERIMEAFSNHAKESIMKEDLSFVPFAAAMVLHTASALIAVTDEASVLALIKELVAAKSQFPLSITHEDVVDGTVH